jgi:hypothetical protein
LLARSDYDQPIARQHRNPAPPAPATEQSVLLRRFMGGFRE